VRVDLLPAKNGRLISHLDGVVELTRAGADRAVIELLRVARDRRAASA